MGWLESIQSWFSGQHVGPLLRGIAMLVFGVLLARLLSRLAERAFLARGGPTNAALARRVVLYGLGAIAIASALREWGFDLGVLLGAAGVLTVALGFASQTSASNVISGLFLIFERPFSVGDYIQVTDAAGVVLSVDLLSVKIRTLDNLFVRIPNEMLVKSVITNYSRFPVRRFDMPLRVGLDTEFAHLERVVAAVVEANPLVLEEPHYRLFVKGLGESHLNLQLSVWAVQDRFVDMRDKIQIEVLHALQGEGIEVPLPHRVIEQRKA